MIFAMLIWGLSWPNAKITGRYADPELLMIWRFIFGTVTMIPIMFIMRIKADFPKKSLAFVIIAAICLVLYNYNYFKGTQIGMAAIGGVIVPTLSPFITYFLVLRIFNQTIHIKEVMGIMIGIFGGLILLRIWEFSVQNLIDSGNIYFILAAFLWAGVTVSTQKTKDELHVLNLSLWLYIFATLFSAPFIPWSGFFSIFLFDQVFWVNFLLISIGSLGFGTTIFLLTAMRLGSEKASSFMYVVPVSAMGFSVLLLEETLPWSTLVGGGLAILAVYLVNRK